MRNKFLIISLAMSSLGFSQNTDSLNVNTNKVDVVTSTKEQVQKVTSVQCSGTSKSTNNRCKLRTRHTSNYCHHHRK